MLSALVELPWAQLIVNGLALGGLYALAALGIVLIFKTTAVINDPSIFQLAGPGIEGLRSRRGSQHTTISPIPRSSNTRRS